MSFGYHNMSLLTSTKFAVQKNVAIGRRRIGLKEDA